MRKSRVLFYTASAALLLSLTACGVTITAVHLPDEVQVNVGATAETAATYESKQEADAAAQQAAADRIDWTWAIADDTIATVDNSGVITGVKGGHACHCHFRRWQVYCKLPRHGQPAAARDCAQQYRLGYQPHR